MEKLEVYLHLLTAFLGLRKSLSFLHGNGILNRLGELKERP